MPLRTTVIGSYPKPQCLKIPDWFTEGQEKDYSKNYNLFLSAVSTDERYDDLVSRASEEVLDEQVDIGIDVVTDGEIRRENYINYFCRRIKGFDFQNLEERTIRNGACTVFVPNIVSKLEFKDATWIGDEWAITQKMCTNPVKMTVPGPMTIIGSTANSYYKDAKSISEDLIPIINAHIKSLVRAGCRHIQLDEPVMVRDPKTAIDYGIDHAYRCFQGVGPDVTKSVHLCCGYPQYLDQTDYQKADKGAYFTLADQLDQAGFDHISIEDAHRRNDLSLFDHFKKTTIVLGSVTIASSRVETVDEIRSRLSDVLKHVPSDRLVVAPDCGLGFLPRNVLRAKLKNMVEAARSFP